MVNFVVFPVDETEHEQREQVVDVVGCLIMLARLKTGHGS